jgi:hypothetical protein
MDEKGRKKIRNLCENDTQTPPFIWTCLLETHFRKEEQNNDPKD